MDKCYKSPSFAVEELPAEPTAEQILQWARRIGDASAPEDIYRHKEGRKTLRFVYRERPYFLKLHTGVGWAEVIKNLIQIRLPVISADNEYKAVLALQRAGVPTLTIKAFASKGQNPARKQSMIVSDELTDTVKLEDFCASWLTQAPTPTQKRRLICAVASIARRMHQAGINHRDFYLCHFHLDKSSLQEDHIRCYLIDLHRAEIRKRTPTRWRIKDLAGLYFSAMDCGLSERDLLRFIRHYNEKGLKNALGFDSRLWRQVKQRAIRLYQKENGIAPPHRASGGG